jgi:pyridoxal 5'-phosphate synthase pdxS subunit
VPFVCGARNLGEALRRINEGATMIRTKGEAGTGNIIEAVRHQKQMLSEIKGLANMNDIALQSYANNERVPFELAKYVQENQKLPVVNFAAGGVATPADAALMMILGSDGVFVGSGIFKSENPARMAKAIVQAVYNYKDPKILAELSSDLGLAMDSIVDPVEKFAFRGK